MGIWGPWFQVGDVFGFFVEINDQYRCQQIVWFVAEKVGIFHSIFKPPLQTLKSMQ